MSELHVMKKYENYPFWIVAVSNIVSLMIYAFGFIIMLRLHWIAAVLYLLYILVLEYRLLKYHCTNCYYWGKSCAFGQGKVSSWFFKKGEPSHFCSKEMTWKNMLPDMLVSVLPLIAGIIIMIAGFDLIMFIAVVLLVLLTTYGNGLVRGKLACNSCKQRELGCPAEKLFKKNKSQENKTEAI